MSMNRDVRRQEVNTVARTSNTQRRGHTESSSQPRQRRPQQRTGAVAAAAPHEPRLVGGGLERHEWVIIGGSINVIGITFIMMMVMMATTVFLLVLILSRIRSRSSASHGAQQSRDIDVGSVAKKGRGLRSGCQTM